MATQAKAKKALEALGEERKRKVGPACLYLLYTCVFCPWLHSTYLKQGSTKAVALKFARCTWGMFGMCFEGGGCYDKQRALLYGSTSHHVLAVIHHCWSSVNKPTEKKERQRQRQRQRQALTQPDALLL